MSKPTPDMLPTNDQFPIKTDRKDTKLQANYEQGRGTQRCGLCAHYRIGSCTKVEGTIHANMYCRHFERKEY